MTGERTRYGRMRDFVDRGRPVEPQATLVGGLRAPAGHLQRQYLRAHAGLRRACLAEQRPGLFVFGLHPDEGPVGVLWLAATNTPRAGTLGRHQVVDLPITRDAGLSLRHLLFVVRAVDGRVRFSAIDLETPNGSHTAFGQQHVTESEQLVVLRTAALSCFCVPTGPTCQLPDEAAEAWRRFDAGPASSETALACSRPRVSPPLGLLTARGPAGVTTLAVDEDLAARGVLLGRADRCELVVLDGVVSRVHAVVLQIDGVPHLVDAGSSHGVTHHPSGQKARCWPLADGDRFALGSSTLEWKAQG